MERDARKIRFEMEMRLVGDTGPAVYPVVPSAGSTSFASECFEVRVQWVQSKEL